MIVALPPHPKSFAKINLQNLPTLFPQGQSRPYTPGSFNEKQFMGSGVWAGSAHVAVAVPIIWKRGKTKSFKIRKWPLSLFLSSIRPYHKHCNLSVFLSDFVEAEDGAWFRVQRGRYGDGRRSWIPESLREAVSRPEFRAL